MLSQYKTYTSGSLASTFVLLVMSATGEIECPSLLETFILLESLSEDELSSLLRGLPVKRPFRFYFMEPLRAYDKVVYARS